MAYAEPKMVKEKDVAEANKDLDVKDRKTRQEAAVALRIAGAPYAEIAAVLDYSSGQVARQAVERSLAETITGDSREQMRYIEARRLERLIRSCWRKATDESHGEHLAAIRTALTLIDRHARLYGLDAPTEMVVYSPSAKEIEEFVARTTRSEVRELPMEADIVDGHVL